MSGSTETGVEINPALRDPLVETLTEQSEWLVKENKRLRAEMGEEWEWPPMPKGFFVVAFDFDGTLSRNVWPSPSCGEPIEKGVEGVLHYFGLGNQVVIYTARPEAHWKMIWRWVEDNGLSGAIYDITNVKRADVGLLFDDKAERAWWK